MFLWASTAYSWISIVSKIVLYSLSLKFYISKQFYHCFHPFDTFACVVHTYIDTKFKRNCSLPFIGLQFCTCQYFYLFCLPHRYIYCLWKYQMVVTHTYFSSQKIPNDLRIQYCTNLLLELLYCHSM